MSERTARLCDAKAIPVESERRCGRLAIGKCFICDNDVCDGHALQSTGGLYLDVYFLMGRRKCEHDATAPQRNVLTQNESALCFNCQRAIDVIRYNGKLATIVQPLLTDALREGLKAALTAEALT